MFLVVVCAFFLTSLLTLVSHSGKGLYKQFLSVHETYQNLSQGADLDMRADPDIEIVQKDVNLPHLECLCLHLSNHTRDTEDVTDISSL